MPREGVLAARLQVKITPRQMEWLQRGAHAKQVNLAEQLRAVLQGAMEREEKVTHESE